MNYVEQEVVFKTQTSYGQDVPLSISSAFLRRLENTVRPSVRMALEGTSSSPGAPPAWLDKASDIRTLGFSEHNGSSVLHLKAPQLGDAAPKLFEQHSLWPTTASPGDTALHVIGRIAAALRREETGSDLYDRPLLKRFSSWGGFFAGQVESVAFPVSLRHGEPLTAVDREVATKAQVLGDQTPAPRQIRLIGKLDMVRHSTRSFGLLLDTGEEVRGLLIEGTSGILHQYFGKDITVLGKAVYRPSGALLRVDALEILPTLEGRHAFSRIPPPVSHPRRPERRSQTARTGVAAFFGTWPGDESDQDLLKALEEIRR